jgi:hypothetical protein
MTITIEYHDGTTEVFPETSRTGGSYCTSGKAELGWYHITDAYGNKTSIPGENIKKITESGGRW